MVGIVLAAVLGMGVGFQLARWTAPDSSAAPGAGTAPHAHAGSAGPGAEVGGLSVSAGGYTLVAEQTSFEPKAPGVLRFRVTAPGGAPVTAFATVHEQPLHLIVARRDLTGYQHLHPTMQPDGTWTTPLTLADPGPWRAFADFSVLAGNGSQTAVALGVDLTVAGAYAPAARPPAARESTVAGYTVAFDGTPQVSTSAPLTFRVFRDGTQVTALEPYLGAYGHLVVLRDGDLGYVHVHAEPQTPAGRARFWLTAPSPGRYQMFFDFKVAGTVHTAQFPVEVT